jgi:tetratricopeptide (TPR) repeat protein
MQSLLMVREYESQESYFPKAQGALLMKKILLTVVLGVAVGAGAQTATQPAQPGQAVAAPTSSVNPPTGSVNSPTGSVNPPTGNAQAAQPTQSAPAAAPVIKDPAEYNAYVAAVDPSKDANAKISGLEAFLTQYPNSVMKNQALEILMSTYQQAGNTKKTMETANKLVAADPCQVRALTLLAYFDRVLAQGGDPNGAQLLNDGKKNGQQGLDCLPKWNKPDGTSDADFQKTKNEMAGIFNAAIGISCLQNKDYACAVKSLRITVDANPQDFSVVYPLALAYLGQTPPDYQNGIWYASRAAAVAPPAAEPQIEKYARSQYVKFHAGDDGWTDVLAAAKANGAQVPIKPAPTPAEQAHKMVQDTPPDKMDFATWEFVLTNGAQEDQDTVWNAIKGKAVQMNGTIISTEPSQFMIAGSEDDITAKKADITLQFEEKVPVKMIPKDGASFDFQGEPASYTPNPFMMTLEKGALLRAKPVAKPPVHHKPAAQ